MRRLSNKKRELADDILLPELKEMYDKGIPLTEAQVAMLYEYGFLTKEPEKEPIPDYIPPKPSNVINLKDPKLSPNEDTRKADEIFDIIEDGIITHQSKKSITKDDWDVVKSDKFHLPESLCAWIDSINKGWRTKIYFAPFDYYCQQADNWIKDGYNYSDQYTDEDKTQFIRDEVKRMRMNTYYFAAKYGKLREGDIEGGGQIIKPYECQKIMWYLEDMGLNIGLIKSRQIGMTSANMLYIAKKAILTQSMFIKFVTEKDDKGIEIMEHKLKYPISRLPSFMKVNMHNDSDKKISFMLKTEKGDISGVNSAVVTEAPYKTVIAGGSPQIVAIDEAGNIPILTEMIQDGRPTMFFNNQKTGKREFRRQLLYWGTGGEMDRGGGALESEWKKAFTYFNDRKFSNGIIPVFFDCFANPFFTEQDYEYEMAEAYATTGADADRAKIKFHQSYPRTIEDVFLRSPDTLIPMSDINKHIERINTSKDKPIFGYLEPIYDQSQPLPINSDTPFKIIGATFIPLSDKDIHRATTTIFSLPDNLWSHRYYQGTDPIDTTSGYSNFASAIYDSLNNSFAAITNFRIPDYRYCYLQSLLLGLFYDPQAKNLIEINRGTPLKDFYISNGFRTNLLYNSMLPPNLQTPNSNEPYGIDKKAKRAEDILHQTKEMYDFMGHNIQSLDFFIQMKTFVRTLNKNGTSKYAVYDPKYFKDDVIDATTYAYINAKAHSHHPPIEKNKANKKIPKWRYSHENNQVTLKKILA